jgi:adenine-specific DNA-methyltransferase
MCNAISETVHSFEKSGAEPAQLGSPTENHMNFKVNESATKLRGGYYTSPDIAAFLLRWVAGIRPKQLLEPSCGDGAFFRPLSSYAGLRQTRVVGFEIEGSEAAKSREALQVHQGDVDIRSRDFLGWSLTHLMEPQFDAAVGNPPFIRYQYLEPELQQRAERLFEYFNLPFTKHTNAWVSFVIASLALLRPGGRLAMVVPAELLHVLHAQSLRTFLGNHCSRILVVDPEELWFEDALQGAVLLLAEKKKRANEHGHGVAIVRTRTGSFLHDDPEHVFANADYANGDTISGKWMRGLLSQRQRDLFRDAGERTAVRRFVDVAKVDVGIVTGANKVFLVSDATVEEYDLHPWAHPMFGRSEHVRGVIYDEAEHQRNERDGFPTNFLWFTEDDARNLPESVRRYLRQAEEEGIHLRYKCRIRSPWYAVPSVYASPVGMLKRSHDFPRLLSNTLGAFTTDTAYRVAPKDGIAPQTLVFSFINSLTALSAELEGRHYGGGVLELVPSEIEKLLIPIRPASKTELRLLDRQVRTRSTAEELLSGQDEEVLLPSGFTKGECEELRAAWSLLKMRRHRATPNEGDQETSSVNGAEALAGA